MRGDLKFKFSRGHAPNPPSTARRWRAHRLRRAIDMDYCTFRFKLKPPPHLENPGSAPVNVVRYDLIGPYTLYSVHLVTQE